jgi:hypothetical protein
MQRDVYISKDLKKKDVPLATPNDKKIVEQLTPMLGIKASMSLVVS